MQQKDKEGLSPVALAEKNGHRKCADYLKIAVSKVHSVYISKLHDCRGFNKSRLPAVYRRLKNLLPPSVWISLLKKKNDINFKKKAN